MRAAEKRLDVWILSIAIILLAIAVTLFFGAQSTGAVFFLGLALIAFANAIELRLLPSFALICFALLPISYLQMDYGRIRGALTPAILVFVVWVARLIQRKAHSKVSSVSQVVGV